MRHNNHTRERLMNLIPETIEELNLNRQPHFHPLTCPEWFDDFFFRYIKVGRLRERSRMTYSLCLHSHKTFTTHYNSCASRGLCASLLLLLLVRYAICESLRYEVADSKARGHFFFSESSANLVHFVTVITKPL
jgi:hypothetical protein